MCPEETHKGGLASFDTWCSEALNNTIPEQKEIRAYAILEYYSVFKALYKYVKKTINDGIIDDINCLITDVHDSLIVKIDYKLEAPSVDPAYYTKIFQKVEDEIGIKMFLDGQKHNMIMLSFCKKD